MIRLTSNKQSLTFVLVIIISSHKMISFRPLLIGLVAASILGSASFATYGQEARNYSTEGYCILAFEQIDQKYLKSYEKRLGFRPKVKLCNRVNRLISEFQPTNWDYQFGQPYPGSSIYLNPEQVAMIKKARETVRQARR